MNTEQQKQSNREKAKRYRDKLAQRTPPLAIGTQICVECKTEKPMDQFNRKISEKTGFQRHCRECNKRINREQYFKHNWGISLEELEQLKLAQNHCCACCGESAELVIDHHHETGIIRELLCSPCNVAIGYLNDSIERVNKLAEYLKKHAGAANPSMSSSRKCLRPWRTSHSVKTRQQPPVPESCPPLDPEQPAPQHTASLGKSE